MNWHAPLPSQQARGQAAGQAPPRNVVVQAAAVVIVHIPDTASQQAPGHGLGEHVVGSPAGIVPVHAVRTTKAHEVPVQQANVV